MKGPLEGIVVADFSRVLAGPYASMLLGDMGATVMKVERPEIGDDTRSWSPPTDEEGVPTYFSSVNRNKHSIALNLDDPDDRARAQRLAHRADIMIENFPAGSLESRGLGYAHVCAGNPTIIYCSISGFGASNDLPGYDLLVQAMGGLMDITGSDDPTKVGVAIVDVVAGLHALTAILAALHHRDRNGGGQLVEVTLLGALLSSLVNQSASAAITGVSPTRMGNAHPSVAPYEPYPTQDRDIIIAVGNDAQFTRLCTALGHPLLASDPRFSTNASRVTHRDELRALLGALLATDTADGWMATLHNARVPCGPVNTISDALCLATDLGLDPVVDVDGVLQITNPVTFSQTPITYTRRPPQLDEHDAWIEEFLR